MTDGHELAAYLESEGVGIQGVSIFLGLKVTLPASQGPFLSLIDTGGGGPHYVHNELQPSVRRPTFQIVCRAANYTTAMNMARAAYIALSKVRNTSLSGAYYLRIEPMQEPFDLGADETGRPKLAFNIHVTKRS